MDATRTVEVWGWQELLIAIADDAKVQTGQTIKREYLATFTVGCDVKQWHQIK
jgi:hypothetical protein